MAPRWSNPSGSIGIQRFRVWPAGEDHYNHIELAQNWDKVDAMIGVAPDGSEWPPTTGVDGGLYAVIKTLQEGVIPIGMMMAWHRPDPAIPLPDGFAICDGTTLSVSEHDFPGVNQSVILPDLRNRFVLGADQGKNIGTAAVAVTDPNIDASAGAPGSGGVGGSNTTTLTLAQLPSHQHGGSGWTGWGPLELQWYNDAEGTFPKAGNYETVKMGKGGQPCSGVGGFSAGQHRHFMTALASEGGGQLHENRPAYYGMIWIMKVKNND